MPDPGSNGRTNERINQLYWDSESTVGDISRELDIGRNALYAAIVPAPSGSTCLECGEETVYTNRTNRAAGTAVCRSCDEGSAPEPVAPPARPEPQQVQSAPDTELERWDRWREDLRSVSPQRAAMIGGAAVLGLVLGAAAARSVRDR